jgi:hypothetical protein
VALLKIDDVVELAAAPQPKALLTGDIIHASAVLEWLRRGDHRHLLQQLGGQLAGPQRLKRGALGG